MPYKYHNQIEKELSEANSKQVKWKKAKWKKSFCQQKGCKQKTYLNKPFCEQHYQARLAQLNPPDKP